MGIVKMKPKTPVLISVMANWGRRIIKEDFERLTVLELDSRTCKSSPYMIKHIAEEMQRLEHELDSINDQFMEYAKQLTLLTKYLQEEFEDEFTQTITQPPILGVPQTVLDRQKEKNAESPPKIDKKNLN